MASRSRAWGQPGVVCQPDADLLRHALCGRPFRQNVAVLVAASPDTCCGLGICISGRLSRQCEQLDQKSEGHERDAYKVPFDLEHWTKVAAEQYPDGLPEPHSDDPTQWLFKGMIPGSTAPLQVAVARLLGYRWPDQEPDDLDELADDDGIVPLPPVRRRDAGAERLRALLARAYGSAWSPALLDQLLAEAGSPGATLESWLRDDFFAQHARLFGNRPFIWQVWDGRKDGFSVLLNYHRLDRTDPREADLHLSQRLDRAADEPGGRSRQPRPVSSPPSTSRAS